MNRNKFGYYKSGGKITYSKLEAFEWGYPEWNFNDELFSVLDWTKEPKLSLWELYKQRARQIRESYDYVVLWYSGGSDSHNLLKAWIEADCKIDEIAATWNYETTGDYQNHQNAEITNVVLPEIKQMKNDGLNFKFRLIDIPKVGLKILNKFPTDFEYYFNYNFQLSSIGKQFLREEITDYSSLINKGKKVAFVWGKEKPYLFFEDNKFNFRFVDSVDDCVGPYSQNNQNQGWYDELFYWTPDTPELPIKMAHVIKNFLRISSDTLCFNDKPYLNYDAGYSPILHKHLKIEVLKTLLYPKWNNDIFCNGKSPSRILGLRDNWVSNIEEQQRQKLKSAIINYISKTEQKDLISLRPIFSRKYWLE